MIKGVNFSSWLFALAVLIGGCKEIPPNIDFSDPVVLAKDTTYITNDLPSGIKNNVLIEDISGVKCNNCPKAAKIAHDIQDNNAEGRVVVMTLHIMELPQLTSPYSTSNDTFNTVVSSEIATTRYIGNISGLPTGGINRKVFDGQTQTYLSYTTWESHVDELLKEEAKAAIDLEVAAKENRKFLVNVTSTFLESDETPVYMSIYLTESKIISKQLSTDGPIDDYEHNYILRQGITNVSGIKLADKVEEGRVFEKGVEFEIPNKYDLENCNIVVLLTKADSKPDPTPDDYQVIQCAEVSVL